MKTRKPIERAKLISGHWCCTISVERSKVFGIEAILAVGLSRQSCRSSGCLHTGQEQTLVCPGRTEANLPCSSDCRHLAGADFELDRLISRSRRLWDGSEPARSSDCHSLDRSRRWVGALHVVHWFVCLWWIWIFGGGTMSRAARSHKTCPSKALMKFSSIFWSREFDKCAVLGLYGKCPVTGGFSMALPPRS